MKLHIEVNRRFEKKVKTRQVLYMQSIEGKYSQEEVFMLHLLVFGQLVEEK